MALCGVCVRCVCVCVCGRYCQQGVCMLPAYWLPWVTFPLVAVVVRWQYVFVG